jgi:hypothetical protein
MLALAPASTLFFLGLFFDNEERENTFHQNVEISLNLHGFINQNTVLFKLEFEAA